MISNIIDRLKQGFFKARDPLPPQHDDSFYDTASDGDDDSGGNPIIDLYNRAVTHPATTVGLLAAAIGVGAAVAFVLAEQRAQKGIEREVLREGKRAKKRLKSWGEDKVLPRIKDYRRKSARRIKGWRRR